MLHTDMYIYVNMSGETYHIQYGTGGKFSGQGTAGDKSLNQVIVRIAMLYKNLISQLKIKNQYIKRYWSMDFLFFNIHFHIFNELVGLCV